MKTWHRIMLLNLVLLSLLALGVWRVGQQWRLFEATRTLEAIGAQAGPGPAAAAMPPLQETTTEGWEDIATQNPFSFDRSSFVYEPENASIRGTDQPVLLGTLMLGGDRMAMMAPAGARNNRSSTTLRVGEEIDGWELVEVREKSVVIEAGTISETVVMNDPSALVPRAAQASSTPSGVTAPVVVSATPAVSEPPRSWPEPTPGAPGRAVDPVPGGERTIRTPFGTVRVPER